MVDVLGLQFESIFSVQDILSSRQGGFLQAHLGNPSVFTVPCLQTFVTEKFLLLRMHDLQKNIPNKFVFVAKVVLFEVYHRPHKHY